LAAVGKFAPLLAAAPFALLALTATGDAQPDAVEKPPLAASAALSQAEQTARFLGAAIPGANFIASASRMAAAYAQNSKLRDIAIDLAKDQTSAANSLAARVNVSGPVVTRQFPYSAGKTSSPKVTAPRLLPAQVNELRQLSQLRGANFDARYLSSLKETLGELQTLYREFGESGQDAGLKAIAQQQLPKVEQTISALDAM
jgi:putative membrane protein